MSNEDRRLWISEAIKQKEAELDELKRMSRELLRTGQIKAIDEDRPDLQYMKDAR